MCLFASIAFCRDTRGAGTKVGPDQLRSLTSDRHKKIIRPREITLGPNLQANHSEISANVESF